MKDITNLIKNSISDHKDILWRIQEFYFVIELLKKDQYEISFWEDEENWASVLYENKVIAYIWKKYPLIFINSKWLNFFSECLNAFQYITFIDTENLHMKEFTITQNDLNDIIDEGLNKRCFSAEDFWFYTI